jgi:hypothetical protein
MKMLLPPQLLNKLRAIKKFRNFLVVFCLFFILIIQSQPASAQLGGAVISTEVASIPTTQQTVKDTWWQTMLKALQHAGSLAYQKALSTALNKIAYDTATYIGSGHSGQKPLFVTQDWGTYLQDAGDAAAGQFIETFVNHLNDSASANCDAALTSCKSQCTSNGGLGLSYYSTCTQNCAKDNSACYAKNASSTAAEMQATPSFNVCSPSSLAAKIQIGLGLVSVNQPQTPDCTASQMIKNWGTDINQKLADLHNPNYLNTLVGLFDPSANDLGIYVQASTDLSSKALVSTENTKTSLIANGGWLNVTDIAGNTAAAPGTAARLTQEAQDLATNNFATISGDVLVDTANVFLNQLALSAFNKLVQSVGSSGSSANSSISSTGGYTADYSSGQGATALQQQINRLLKPNFSTQADYDILSSLAICTDASNPGPDNCVIDSQFMQAISEKKTVAEAVSAGYLHSDWQITADTSGGAYNSSYSLRDIEILVKYRILPVGWEQAAAIATSPTKPIKATIMDLLSCFDGYNGSDQYNTFSSGFTPAESCASFQGLVDPNWVLKAPLNYCQKEGIGAQILSTVVTPGVNSNGVTTASSLSITRADSYCADNQTCIQEKSNGSCEAYGYCNGEKRTWDFSGNSCDPVYNTCQAFTSDSGQSAAYLENTLNYGSCTADNAGCKQYALTGSYASSTSAVTWSSSQSLYLNKNLISCSSSDEGCTGLIIVHPTWGSNLVMDSDFSNDTVGDSSAATKLNDWPIYGQASVVDASQEPGGASGKALKLANVASTAGVYSNPSNSLLPANLQIIPGQAYTLSADVYLTQSGSVRLIMGDAADGFATSTTTQNSWQHLAITRPADSSYNDPIFSIIGTPSTAAAAAPITFYVQNIKLEMSNWDTGYSAYGAANFIHEKIIPPYLEQSCYVNPTGANKDYSLKSGAPSACSNYARKCNQSEVGCNLYTNTADAFAVPARVSQSDYCSQDCVGYDVYVSQGSYFHSPASENLMPTTATACSAANAGCTEFTNLDTLAAGGEGKEYYSQLKQCIKPSTDQCSNFYAWAGQTSGYQLQTYSLEKDASGLPAVTSDDSALCNAIIYNSPVSDPQFNADCQRFYDASGRVSYHLISKTITCSDNCHAYRMTDKNIDLTKTDQASCSGTDQHWDSTAGDCLSCLNGGTWDNTAGACVYQAIPGEGQTCSASANGCREYNGNNGSNVQVDASYDFESGLEGWTSNCSNGGGVSLSTIANSKDGHSLQYTAGTCANMSAAVGAGGSIDSSSAYTIKFLAQASAATTLQFNFVNTDTGLTTSFGAVTVAGDGNWHVYQTNLAGASTVVGTSSSEFLTVSGNNNFYLDDLVLSQISDRYYLIKGSSQIPDACYYDISGNYQGADYNLGCSKYTDRAGSLNYLRQFTKLCSDSAVGCEQMIDTKNYSPYGAGYWESGTATTTCDSASDKNCVAVPGDSAIYAVYDTTKACSASSQGCSRLGQGQGGANLTGWANVYELNNPDKYSSILCDQGSVGCQAWTSATDNTVTYFKDPGYGACTYRASQKASDEGKKAWYKIPAKRCDANSDGTISGSEIGTSICVSNSDCSSGSCITDNNDYACAYTTYKTIGSGGVGNAVPTPSSDAGLCDSSSSSCTEYIDPVSQFNANLVANPSFQTTCDSSGNNCIQDGWGAAATGVWRNSASQIVTPGSNQQVVTLEPNKLYSFYIGSGTASPAATISFNFNVLQLSNNNVFSSLAYGLTTVGVNQPVIFDSLNNSAVLLQGGDSAHTIVIKELAVNYELQSSLDKTSCNGSAQFTNGCVLFNERSISGATGPTALTYDAQTTEATTTSGAVSPAACDSSKTGSCTANQVIKVTPDRVCSQWLSCTSYTQDASSTKKTCYAFGECNHLDSKGECDNFINSGTTAATLQAADNQNATGYSLLGYYNLNQMSATGTSLSIASGDFEDIATSSDTLPECSAKTSTSGACQIDNPDEAAKGGTDYPAHGLAYLKVAIGPYPTYAYSFATIPVNVTKSINYFINYLVNTKNSAGVKARVIITNADTKKVIATFDSLSNSGWTRQINKFTLTNTKNIIISLASDATTVGSNGVYFDDVNIAPVLQISDGQYAAPECRLYPTDSSLTCVNKNTNTISQGLQGYCLEHDPANSNICLLWYPADSIPVPTLSSSGYQGAFPLNYCTNVNGNFDLIEKRVGYFLMAEQVNSVVLNCDGTQVRYGNISSNTNEGCYKITGYKQCLDSSNNELCSSDYNLWLASQPCPGNCDGNYYFKFICIPKTSNLLSYLQTTTTGAQSDSSNNWAECKGESFTNGFGLYNGLQGPESTNMNPPIAVYDYYNKPTSESELEFPYATSSATNVFHVTCTNLVNVVDGSGNNKAWAQRVSSQSTYATNTPPFFQYNQYNLQGYGQSLNAAPFGAAQVGASSGSTLYDMFGGGSSDYAGRPYGCTNGTGSGCQYIGYCQNNINTYCLATTTSAVNSDLNIAYRTCNTADDKNNGLCIPLWSTSTPPISTTAYQSVLKNIFLKSWDNQYDFSASSSISQCSNNIRPDVSSSASFCEVFPTVFNVSLYYGDSTTKFTSSSIKQTGLYRLEFNTSVDPEQEPMKSIYIDWGDGHTQTITDQNDHPLARAPHIFYHWYSAQTATIPKIKIYDNWGAFGSN